MSNETKRWVYSTIKTSQNKGIERIALTGSETAHELAGIDGSMRFGIRPSSGMKLAHELNVNASVGLSTDHNYASEVTDCFPVQFHIKEGEFGHGFVYRIKNAFGANVAIYMDYCPTNTVDSATGWRTILITSGGSATAEMDVVSIGKFVSVFVQSEAVRLFHIQTNSSNVSSHVVVDGGPGDSPTLLGPNDEASWAASSIGDARQSFPFMDGSTYENPPALWSGEAKLFVTSATGHDNVWVDSNTDGNDDASTTTPFLPVNDYERNEPGDYSFGYYLNDSKSGRRTALSDLTNINSSDFGGQNTKRFKLMFNADTSKYDQIFIFRSVRTQESGGAYGGSILHLDNIYDFTDLLKSRDVSLTTSSSPFFAWPSSGAGSSVEAFVCCYELNDLALSMQDVYLDKTIYDAEMPRGKSAVAFDGTLLVADPLGGTEASIGINDRVRNSGELRWSSTTERSPELFPINNKFSSDVFQNRVEKLVRVGEFAVGFSSDRLYHIRRNAGFLQIEDLHAGFGLAGQNAAASAGPLAYFVTTKGLKAVANSGQLDDVEFLDNLLMEEWKPHLENLQMEFDPYSSCLFILNPNLNKAVCLWFNVGRVSELHDMPFTRVKKGIWPRIWSTKDPVPDASTSMVERAFFLQNHPSPTSGNRSTNWKPRVYLLDQDRSKNVGTQVTKIAANTPAIRTMDFQGDGVMTISNVADAITSGRRQLNLAIGTQLQAGGNSVDLTGAFAYVIKCPKNPDLVGSKFQILFGSDAGLGTTNSPKHLQISTSTMSQEALVTGVLEGAEISLSPMYVHWVGHAIPMTRTVDGKVMTQFDMFNNKHISSIGCHFTDVSGGYTRHKFFRGEVWNSVATSPSVQAIPSDFAGVQIGDSVQNGESSHYAAFKGTDTNVGGKYGIQDSVLNPGLEIFCSDLDFKLMAVVCRGRATSTDTSVRSSS